MIVLRIIEPMKFGLIVIFYIVIAILSGVFYNYTNGNYYGINIQSNNVANAHFFGATKRVDSYQVAFQTFPFVPFAGENSTLNFSILDTDNSNINNVFATLILKEKDTGGIIAQIPYKFYEFSDITFPYRFQNNARYVATLEAKIVGDPKYDRKPLTADFDFAVGSSPVIPFKELILYYVLPASIILIIVSAIYVYVKKKKHTNNIHI